MLNFRRFKAYIIIYMILLSLFLIVFGVWARSFKKTNNLSYLNGRLVADDNIPPSIENISFVPKEPKVEDIIYISANITDNTGVKTVLFYYKTETSYGNSDWNSTTPAVSDTIYTVALGPFEHYLTVYFYFFAEDLNGNKATSPVRLIYVLSSKYDSVPPDISNVGFNPQNPSLGDTITIYASVTDASGVDAVYIYYHRVAESFWQEDQMIYSNGKYYYTLGPFSHNTTISFYIVAIDIYGNEASSILQYFTVTNSTTLNSTDFTYKTSFNLDSAFLYVSPIALFTALILFSRRKRRFNCS